MLLGLDDSDNEGEGDEDTTTTNNNNKSTKDTSNNTADSATNVVELIVCDGRKYDNIGYGCVRADYVAHGIKMINVEIPEPLFYQQFRDYNKQQYDDSLIGGGDNSDNGSGVK